MGGPGSGRWCRGETKDTVEHCLSLDVRAWQQGHVLHAGHGFTTRWSNHQGEVVASVGMRVQHGRVLLSYRVRCGGDA